MFKGGLIYDGNTLRIPQPNFALLNNPKIIKEKELPFLEQPEEIISKLEICTTYGIRTRDSSVKGRRLNPLTNAAFFYKGRQR